ncbi:MAG: recombinase family protein [Pararoseburia sp.]|nr:recombinase family protein [Pararoseburia sp.]
MAKKHVALYVRVSTEEQKNHGLSVDSQIDALEKYCAEHDYAIFRIYNDAGHSAAKRYTTRPALLQLMEDCSHGMFELILFTRLDRWFRSVPDYYQVQSVLDHNHIAWRAIWEDYETETSEGVFKVNIMLSIAQAEAQRTSEKIRSVFQYKRDSGGYVGQPPMGYIRINKRDLIIDDSIKDAIHELFKAYLNTNSLVKAVQAAHDKGLQISIQQAYRILKKEAYAGLAAGGYKCPAYISWEDHEKILSMMKQHTRKTIPARTYYFSGILFCENCGYRLAAGAVHKQSASGEDYYIKYYRCNGFRGMRSDCPGSYLNEKKLEKYLLEHLDAELNRYNVNLITHSKECDPVEIKKQIAALESRMRRIGDRYEDGDISRDEYKNKRYEITHRINTLRSLIAKSPTPIHLDNDWMTVYQGLDAEHKRQFWRSIIERIEVPTENSYNVKIHFC